MKKIKPLLLLFLCVSLWWSCSDGPTNSTDNQTISAKKQFVWEGMNFWYLWQQEVDKLADDFKTTNRYHNYLQKFDNAKALFEDLRYSEDRFSWFVDNYKKQAQAFKGISKSFGFSYGLPRIREGSDKLIGYVQYVIPNTPADKAGLQRGDLFTKVNGQTLTVDNYFELLQNDTYTLTLATIEGNAIRTTDQTVQMQAVEIHKNPVFMAKVIDTSGVKVGYLMLNAFRANYHRALNDSIGALMQQGIDELVLDLRYNGGGAFTTCVALASMISGKDSTHVFAKFNYNEKRSALNSTQSFLNKLPVNNKSGGSIPMNKLSLDRLYVLTGSGTASASEMVINGLKPYIDVILIGEQTVGKDVGSITIYDSPSPYVNKEKANPDHTIALQPIVVRITNSEGESYSHFEPPRPESNNVGFPPDYPVFETAYLKNLPPLGDPDDPLLAQALQLILNPAAAKQQAAYRVQPPQRPVVADSRDLQPFGKAMHLLQMPKVHTSSQ